MAGLEEFNLIEWLQRTMKSEGYNKLREFQARKVQKFVETCTTHGIALPETEYARGAIEGYACDIFDELLNELNTNKELAELEQKQKAEESRG